MRLRNLATAAVASLGLMAGSASAANIDLAFLMDESGSVDAADYLAAMDSLADALDASIPVGGADTYTITVISFSGGASVDVGPTTINTAGDLAAVTTAIRNATYSGGGTSFAAAFTLLNNTVTTLGDASLINMMTDGFGGNPTVQRDALITSGWDSLSFEAVGSFTDIATMRDLAFDTAGTGLQPLYNSPAQITDPLNDAFVLEVSGFGPAFDAAIAAKVQKIVTPGPSVIPLPAGLPLILLGLGALGGLRLRSRKTA
ncbi:vWA domain-containing protein [Maliponia aquimaris]|jgi:hypothetical protein|uniref:von Willebrand factor type A domain protein n=1 Tax=Maliponia aquimaris TaxID=1673631 RepID=A0A238K8E3_9RHOB|nr:VWA domain-containing protein [Maliponia aquimaris]SMX39160.1 von Willebrand factor type A domain protein [Maliponia aquimaris]